MERRKFLIGIDGSPAALAALRCAAALVSSKEDELLLLAIYENHISSVLHVEPGILEEESKIHNQREAAAHKHLDDALSEVHKLLPGFKNIHGMLRGSPAVGETITKLAVQESKPSISSRSINHVPGFLSLWLDCTHIFLGRREMGTMKRALQGSVSDHVLKQTRLPLTLVKASS